MIDVVPKSDWKVFRELREVALERFCLRVITELETVLSDDLGAHERYLEAHRLLRERDRSLSEAFDAPRRSVMLLQLATISRLDLLTSDEMSRFGAATRQRVAEIVDLWETP